METDATNIVAIGAGSTFGRGLIADVLSSAEFGDSTKLSLVDTDPVALDRMQRFAARVKEHYGSPVELEAAADHREVLPGATHVITSVAIQRYPLWEQDFRLPVAHGFRHVLGENGGPGAMFHALRNIKLMLPICRDMEELCPEALLLNFTNPVARMVRAISELTTVKTVGLCHGAGVALAGISRIMGRPLEELDIVSGGLNHFFWVTRVRDRVTGEDLYPSLRERVLTDPDCPHSPRLVKKMVEVFGLYTYPSDDHIGEYLSFGAEFSSLKWPYGQESWAVSPNGRAPESSGLEEYASGEAPLDDQALGTGGELAVPIVKALVTGQRYWADSVNIVNLEGYVPDLPGDAVVEVPAWVDGDGIHPEHIDALPKAIVSFCHTQAAIQSLIVEGFRTGSRNALLQALLVDPVIDSVTGAEKLLDEMLELQKDYLPQFS